MADREELVIIDTGDARLAGEFVVPVGARAIVVFVHGSGSSRHSRRNQAVAATLRAHFGSLDRVHRVIKLLGMVNSAPDFYDHPKVINGCSELFAEVWGPEFGIGARSAVGLGPLPGNIAVEIEAVFEIKS